MSKQLPEGLPPLPEGAVYLGKGGRDKELDRFVGWRVEEGGAFWRKGSWVRYYESSHYAAPAEIARLNGLSPDPNDGLPFGLTWDSPELKGYDEVRRIGDFGRWYKRKAGGTWIALSVPKHIVENSLVTRPKPEPECAGKVVEIDGKRFRLVPVEADSE